MNRSPGIDPLMRDKEHNIQTPVKAEGEAFLAAEGKEGRHGANN